MDNLILLAVIVAAIISAKLISYISTTVYQMITRDVRTTLSPGYYGMLDRTRSVEAPKKAPPTGVAATWRITTPNGETMITDNLRHFGERMGWNIASLKSGAAGRRRFRGHSFERLS